MSRRTLPAVATALLLAAAALPAQTTPKVFHACYVPASGTVYRIRETDLKEECTGTKHVYFTWTDGAGALRAGDAAGGDLTGFYPNPMVAGLLGRALATTPPAGGQVLAWDAGTSRWTPTTPAAVVSDHGSLGGLGDDDHPQYLRADGTRPLAGNLDAAGNKFTGLAAGAAAGEALVYGQAAAGDVAGALPTLSVTGLQGRPVNAGPPASGQVLGWNGSQWTPTTPAGGVSDHGGLSGLADDDHAQYLIGNGARSYAGGFAVTGTHGSGALAATGAGTRMVWYPRKSAFRAGAAIGAEWDDANIGNFSVGFGLASAAGDWSTASGFGSSANGGAAVSLGYITSAPGAAAVALGWTTTASGNFSTALGTLASTNNQSGSFVYGDQSSPTVLNATLPNQFSVRASGGVRFFTNPALTTGCAIPAGGGAWACTSSRSAKEDFQDLDGETALEEISRMPIQSWSYKTEPGVRHLGPTAQDFHAAFGLGASDETISTVDADGVSLLAIQALERRTRELEAENTHLRQTADAVLADLVELRARLEAVEAERRPR